ncbi:MAG: hypothetical protein JWO98_508 [Frankiales bacterium]|nr:hypothetical protein [Frankiales bacterium]
MEEQLATRRAYTRAEVAQALNIKDSQLKRWVTARCIPHQRSGNPDGKQQRGVCFTWADILAIGEMLPHLLTPRQAQRAAAANPEPAVAGVPEAISEAMIDEWARLGVG